MTVGISSELRSLVHRKDGDRCAYCQSPQELTVTAFEVDHIIPLSAGGSNDAENVCLACPTCNRYKAARQEAGDPRTGLLAPLFHPRSQSWHDHFAWIDDASQIVGLTPTGRATVAVLQMNRPQIVHLRRLWRKMGYVLA